MCELKGTDNRIMSYVAIRVLENNNVEDGTHGAPEQFPFINKPCFSHARKAPRGRGV